MKFLDADLAMVCTAPSIKCHKPDCQRQARFPDHCSWSCNATCPCSEASLPHNGITNMRSQGWHAMHLFLKLHVPVQLYLSKVGGRCDIPSPPPSPPAPPPPTPPPPPPPYAGVVGSASCAGSETSAAASQNWQAQFSVGLLHTAAVLYAVYVSCT